MVDKLRTCNFAGKFFPDNPQALVKMIDGFIANAANRIPKDMPAPMGIISPHAGFRFSGEIAALSYYSAFQNKKSYKRILILSPSHRHAFEGIALPSQNIFESPIGKSKISKKITQELINKNLIKKLDAAHDNEHGIETQLPFIQKLWPKAEIIPLVVGRSPLENVIKIFEHCHSEIVAGNTLVVISTDLSHFLNNEAAVKKDSQTAGMIETFNHQGLRAENACGYLPLQAYLSYVNSYGYRISRLGMINSSAKGGDSARVVGYGAWHFVQNDMASTPFTLQKKLLSVARKSIEFQIEKNKRPIIYANSFHPILQSRGTCFVSLKKDGLLRGCIGSTLAQHSLVESVGQHAVSAGFNDKRFKAVTAAELEQLKISISILSTSTPMHFKDEQDLLSKIEPNRHGLILTTKTHRGIFLPVVWESLKTVDAFWQGLKVKAGLPKDYWSDDIKLSYFTAENFSD